MWPAGSIEDMRSVYEKEGRVTEAGIWSILLTPTKSDAAEFAQKYFSYFNNLSQSVWHLKVFAEYAFETGSWRASQSLFDRSDEIRSSLKRCGLNVPPMCILFLSTSKPESELPCSEAAQIWAVLPLDEKKLANEAVFKAGLQATREVVDLCFRELKIERHDPLTQEDTDRLIALLQKKLKKLSMDKKLACYLVKPAKWVVLAVISSILGLPISAVANGSD